MRRRWVLFLGPFLVVQVVNLWVGGYFKAHTDSGESSMVLGQNWLDGNPLKVFHMPAYTHAQLSAIILAWTGPNLHHFQAVGLALQTGLAGVVGLWLARSKTLTATQIGLLGLVTATNPTMMAWSRVWNPMFLVGLVGVVAVVLVHEREEKALFWVGLMSANLFLALAFLPSILLMANKFRALVWAVVGWLLGANLLAPYWFWSLADAILGKGGATSGPPDLVWFFWEVPSAAWLSLGLILVLRMDWFVGLALTGTILGVSGVALHPQPLQPGDYGIAPLRYFILLAPLVGYGLLVVRGRLLHLLVVGVALICLIEYGFNQVGALGSHQPLRIEELGGYQP